MKIYNVRDSPDEAAFLCRTLAEKFPCLDGRQLPYYKVLHMDVQYGLVTQLVYSRDTGHHSSGWLKNPDYERCYHLSISFASYSALRQDFDYAPFQKELGRLWLDMIFTPEQRRCLWEESAKSPEGIIMDVRHYRVFCNEYWQPIVPRGEVYSKENTPMGWQSWSEQHKDFRPFHLSLENPDK